MLEINLLHSLSILRPGSGKRSGEQSNTRDRIISPSSEKKGQDMAQTVGRAGARAYSALTAPSFSSWHS